MKENSLKKICAFIAIAMLASIINIKYVSWIAAIALLFVAGAKFNQRYNNKKVLTGAIIFSVGVVLQCISKLIVPAALAELINNFTSNMSSLTNSIYGETVDTNSVDVINSIITTLSESRGALLLSSFISMIGVATCSLGFYFAVCGYTKESANSEESSAPKKAKTIVIFEIIETVLCIILISIALNLVGSIQFVEVDGEMQLANNITSSLILIAPILLISIAVGVLSIIAFVFRLIIIFDAFKVEEKQVEVLEKQETLEENKYEEI